MNELYAGMMFMGFVALLIALQVAAVLAQRNRPGRSPTDGLNRNSPEPEGRRAPPPPAPPPPATWGTNYNGPAPPGWRPPASPAPPPPATCPWCGRRIARSSRMDGGTT